LKDPLDLPIKGSARKKATQDHRKTKKIVKQLGGDNENNQSLEN